MEEKSNFYVKADEGASFKSDNSVLVLNIHELLELQRKYTTLECECKRFADWAINMLNGQRVMAIEFDDEYLNMVGNMLFEALGRKQNIKDIDPEEIIKELKK